MSFLSLPKEIRESIYDCVIGAHSRSNRGTRPTTITLVDRLPSHVLYLSRQIRSEVYERWALKGRVSLRIEKHHFPSISTGMRSGSTVWLYVRILEVELVDHYRGISNAADDLETTLDEIQRLPCLRRFEIRVTVLCTQRMNLKVLRRYSSTETVCFFDRWHSCLSARSDLVLREGNPCSTMTGTITILSVYRDIRW